MLVGHWLAEQANGQREIGQQETQRSDACTEFGPRPEVVKELYPSDGTPDGKANEQNVDKSKVRHHSTEPWVQIGIDAHCNGEPEYTET